MGGLWDEWDEGAGKRRCQHIGVGWLVGGGVHTRSCWALGDGKEHGEDKAWDCAEAEALYRILEREVVPQFYTRNERGIPAAWVARMRESMARLTPHFSASRAVCEYTEKHYIPAAAAYLGRAANKGALGKQVADWQQGLEEHWNNLRFGAMQVAAKAEVNAFEVEVFACELDLDAVRVEIYADGVNGGEPLLHEMKRLRELPGNAGGYVYGVDVSVARPAKDYTVRATLPWYKYGRLQPPYAGETGCPAPNMMGFIHQNL